METRRPSPSNLARVQLRTAAWRGHKYRVIYINQTLQNASP